MADAAFVDRRKADPAPPTNYPWYVLPGLACFVLVVFAGVAAASFMTDDTTLRTQTANTWSNLAIAVVAYWYGSSAGSTKKDDALAATSIKQNETIAAQGQALAASAPVTAPVTAAARAEGDAATVTTKTEPAAKS